MNKVFRALVLVAVVMAAYFSVDSLCLDCAQAAPGAGAPFTEVRYYANGGTGSGKSASNPAAVPTTAVNVMSLTSGMLVTKAYVVVDTAITGTTALNLGDDDSSNGYCPTASVTLGTAGMYCWDAKTAGSYLRTQTAGATDALDIYVVPNAKFYKASKSVKLSSTTANTAGAFRVVVEGYNFGR